MSLQDLTWRYRDAILSSDAREMGVDERARAAQVREDTAMETWKKLYLLVPTSTINGPMTDEQIAQCQRIINSQLSLYDQTRGCLAIVADLERNTAIPLYQSFLDNTYVRDTTTRYEANLSYTQARERYPDWQMRQMVAAIDEALGIYLGADAD